MNQIYNLAQTIAADKETITTLEKHLLNAKSILAAHENAMERITTVPNVIVSDRGIAAARGLVQEDKPVRERITQENYLELGIEVGDEVNIVFSGDKDFESGTIVEVIGLDFNTDSTFLELRKAGDTYTDWYWYDHNEEGVDELYLIRTPEGSLNK